MGSVVIVWAVLRLTGPLAVHGLLDGVARALFTAWMAYALAQGVPGALWPFLGVEAAWGVAQSAPWLRAATRRRTGGRPAPAPARDAALGRSAKR
ncbi:hypothetical protein J2X68_000580 [Streptomyces sp. 3330]|uniref:hypothetical protein n=1 Tax=Streptomyces sp. 3330 TaxID=2817755 RepID=UPI00285D6933|nr:hypothetical protein [Streptomyces sp. 3330]